MADDVSVTREGDTLVIRIPIKTPTPSASGKTLVIASTRGNQKTAVQIDGKAQRKRPSPLRHRDARGEAPVVTRGRRRFRA